MTRWCWYAQPHTGSETVISLAYCVCASHMPPTNSTREIHPAARARFAPSFVSTRQRFALNAIAVLALMAAGKPASAEYFTYQGQMQIQTIAGDVCSSLMSENTFNIVVPIHGSVRQNGGGSPAGPGDRREGPGPR